MSNRTLYIGADFSIAKPALSLFYNNKLYFAVFPQKITDKEETILKEGGIEVFNRNLDVISKTDPEEIFKLTKRYTDLSLQIWDYINTFDFDDCYFASEGLSYGSKGNVTLELSGAKYILLSTLYNHKINRFYTYSPITLKKTAGVSKKEPGQTKSDTMKKLVMIEAFKKEQPLNRFMEEFINNDKQFVNKTAYIHTIDDIVDSYWCLKTLSEKENLNLFR